jgi:hypothetical protein
MSGREMAWCVGLPVGLTLADDGRLSVWVDLSEMAEDLDEDLPTWALDLITRGVQIDEVEVVGVRDDQS